MKKIKLTSILVLSLVVSIFISSNSYADEITNIAGFTELNKCYTGQGAPLKKDIGDIKNGLSIDKMFTGDKDGKVAIPNNWQNTIADGNLSCEQLIVGYDRASVLGNGGGKWPALISGSPTGTPATLTQDKAIPWLEKMGYKAEAGSGSTSGGNCVKITYIKKTSGSSYADAKTKNGKEIYTHELCVDKLTDNKIASDSKFTVNENGEKELTKVKVKNGKLNLTKGSVDLTVGTTWKTIVENFYNTLKANRATVEWSEGTNHDGTRQYYHAELKIYDPADGLNGGVSDGDYDKKNNHWVFDTSAANAAKIAISKNSSYSDASALKFSADQKTSLHQHYFATYFKAKLICEGDDEYSSLTAGADTVKAKNVTSKTCYARAENPQPKHNPFTPAKVHAITDSLTWYVDYTFEELVNHMTEDELTGAAAANPDAANQDDSDAATREPDCQTRSGALGWIICPLITTAADYIQRAYSNLIEPFLSIDAILFDTSTNGGKALRSIWSIFQGFANLVFVIVFLVVIFSQLTGVGIDNYGIKKILPKLIVGAILINLSYFICQLAIDLSNILGRAIGGLFNNMSAEIDSDLSQVYVNLNPTEATGMQAFLDIAKENLGMVKFIAGILAFGAFLAAGPVIIIPALMALISLAVGAFFLFALLAIRQAVAVILVVVSPLAFAAYMLPNTKSLFKRWLDTFKGLLMAYPIASALVFGGEFVSKILLAASTSDGGSGGSVQKTITSLGIILSAAVVAVAPIFYIPSLIKKSLSALSGVTAALATRQKAITSGAQKRVDSGIRNSGWQRTASERNQRIAAGIGKDGKLTTLGRLQNTWPSRALRGAGGRAKLAEARSKALGNVNSSITSDRMLTSAGVLAAGATIANKAKSQLVDDEIANMEEDTKNYNVDVMEGQLKKILSSNEINADNKVKAQALMKKLSQSGGDGNKRLASIIRNDTASDAGKQLLASYATSTDIAGNIGNKDAYVAQYLRDFQAGTNSADKSFEVWSSTERFGSDGKSLGSNEEFVAQKQLDDDERLLQQSTDSLKQTYEAGSLDKERAARIQGNDNLNKKDDQHKILTNVKNLTDEQYAARRNPKDKDYVNPFDIKPKNTPRPGQSTP